MQIDKLQIELRPRSNAQALDLGYALLRSHAGAAYMAFTVLWLPLAVLAAVLSWFYPDLNWLWLLVMWWVKPIIERAPLYVLSRQVFGTAVSWQEAVRAWPRQLGGGWFRLLTWGRPFAAGRALYQPVWQLENARGKVASVRMRVLARERTGSAAYWFGIICAHLEGVLQLGLYGLIGFFLSDTQTSNPLALFFGNGTAHDQTLAVLAVLVYGVVTAVVAPVYTACGFTLYLNRRATLEAWDLELKLRQIVPPASHVARHTVGAIALATLLAVTTLIALPSAPAYAAPAPQSAQCKPPPYMKQPARPADLDPAQTAIRAHVDAIYAGDDLRGYTCEEGWVRKVTGKKEVKPTHSDPMDLDAIAAMLKAVLIATAVGVVLWFLYRYRDRLPKFGQRRQAMVATEVGGLDIRAESLPADVPLAVRTLWDAGEQRAALALLYRATLSRLVSQEGLVLRQGDTEGDCLRLCRVAHQQHRLARERLDIAVAATTLWLDGAYGNRWPASADVHARCDQWGAQFPATEGARA